MSRATRAVMWGAGVLGMALAPTLTPATVGDADPDRGPGVVAEQEETEPPPGFLPGRVDRREGIRAPGILCEGGGRYLVDGPPLFGGRDVRADTVSIVGQQISIGTACPLVPIVLRLSGDGTLVHARWPACAALPRGARLEGVIRGPTCGVLDGTLHVSGQGRGTSFRAYLIPCLEAGESECAPEDQRAGAFQRWLGQFSVRAFPRRSIPKGALGNAYAELAGAPAWLDRWVSIGPAPMSSYPGSEDPKHVSSGRVAAIAVDPGVAGHWLIGAATGGVWETHDAGGTWAPRTDDQASLAVEAIAFAPNAPSVVYAGTGASHGIPDNPYPGVGLLKSGDGGSTWTLVGGAALAGLSVAAIQVSPASPDLLTVAALDPLTWWLQVSLSPPGTPPPGVYRSTTGGTQWTRTLSGEATDLVAYPTDFNRQYAALGKRTGTPGGSNVFRSFQRPNGLYRSLDGGQTWTWVGGPWTGTPGGVGEIRLALSPSHPSVLYASIRNAKTGGLLGVWKTQNAWAATPAWVEVPQSGIDFDLSHDAITVHPTDPDVLYLGSTLLWKFQGGTWVSLGVEDAIHEDMDALAWAPPLQLLAGTDGGLYQKDESSDGLWVHHNTNLAITQFFGGAVHPADPDRPLGAAQDNGVSQRIPAFGLLWKWFSPPGGDGMSAMFGTTPDRFGFSLQQLILLRSIDAGATIESVDKSLSPADHSVRMPQIRRCPANENVVLVTSYRVLRSDNFFSAATGQDVGWSPNSPSGYGPTALAFAPSDPTCNTYAVGTGDGGIYLTTAGGGISWSDLDPGKQLPGRWVTSLAFSPTSPDTLYVTLSGFDEGTPGKPGHVFKTTNATATAPTWTDVSPPVNLPHTSVVVAPPPSETVYVGTDMGLWVSDDGGATWKHAGPASGLPNVPVYDITVDPCGVTAFTFGRGAFRNAVPFVCP